MKDIPVSISFDRNKLRAIRLYLAKEDKVLEDEVCKMLDSIYENQVPPDVRDYLCMCSDVVQEPTNKVPRRKNAPSPMEVTKNE